MRRLFLLALLIALAGCNLATSDDSSTPTSFGPLPTTSYVAPTPYIAPPLVNGVPVVPQVITAQPQAGAAVAQGVILVTVTPVPGQVVIAVTATPLPGQIVIQQPVPSPTSQNIIEAFVNNLIIPAWNFLYTFFLEGLSTLWLFAGARGGGFAQVFCCIGPIVVIIGALIVRFRPIGWRRR
jgi:hypothetical protein